MKQLERYKDIAIKATEIGGKILLKHFEKIAAYDIKKGAGFVTKADMESEEAISSFLRKQTPDFGIFAEEGGNRYKGNSRWIIDPLDGTTNFFHHVPHFNISIALEINKEVVVGVVYDPIKKEMFNCRKGGGAYRNNSRIYVSKTKKLSTAMLATGFAYMRRDKLKEALDLFLKFSVKCHGIRRFGAAALDSCYVAAGIYDGFYEKTLNPWDVAAGALLVTEAGGKVSSYNGDKFSIYSKEIVVSNGLIHQEMIKTMER